MVSALKTLEDWDPADRRPMVLIGKTVKGYWPAAVSGKIPDGGDQVVGYPSHPYAMKMNSEYFVALASHLRAAATACSSRASATACRRRPPIAWCSSRRNMDVAMSVLDKNGLGDWLADRLVEIGDSLRDDVPLRLAVATRPVPGRAPARRQPAPRAADGQGHQPGDAAPRRT